MPKPANIRLRYLLGLLAIIALYSVYNVYLDDNQFIDNTSRATRHVLRFATILIAYGIGVVVFNKTSSPWLVQVWHVLYLGALLVLVVLGVLDAATKAFTISFRTTIVTLHEFLISPVPFVIAWLLGSYKLP